MFSRERYAFKEGDRQRGRNQMAVIQGVVDKVTQPSFLKNYLSVMDSLDGCFETNIPYDLIASLVRKQLDEGGSWQVLSYSVNGTRRYSEAIFHECESLCHGSGPDNCG